MDFITSRDVGPLATNQLVDEIVSTFICVITGNLLSRCIRNAKIKKYLGSFIGIFIIILFGGPKTIFFVLSTVIVFLQQSMPIGLKMSLILLLRMVYSFMRGIGASDPTSIKSFHMYFTLRCVSVVYEMGEYRQNKNLENHRSAPLKMKHHSSVIDKICYLTFAPALGIGPFYTYQTYYDCIYGQSTKIDRRTNLKFSVEKFVRAIVNLVLCKVISFILTHYIPINFENFADVTISQRFAFIIFSALNMSSYLYALWSMGELACVSWQIGAYKTPTLPGKGPVSLDSECEWNYNTISNGNLEMWFFEDSWKNVLLKWNTTVQWWLVRYCYTRHEISRCSRFLKLIVTQIVNAAWHGGQPGSIITLCCGPFGILLEEKVVEFIKRNFDTDVGYRFAKFCKMIIFQWLLLPVALFCFIYPLHITKYFILAALFDVLFLCLFVCFLACVVESLCHYVK